MLRHRAARASAAQVHLLVSARSADELLYRDELASLEPRERLLVEYTYTRAAPPGWSGWSRRVDAEMVAEVSPGAGARCFACGPTAFVEHVTELLVAAGHAAHNIHAERFGPTGGG